MATRSLAEVADELYALVPEEFVAARDAAAKQARDGRQPDLAAEIKQLRRPPVGAWLVNNLVRNDDGRLDDLFDLGAALREAQQALDGAELRAMSRQRHQLVAALSGYAVELAGQSGHRVAESAQRDVEATLEAALADPDAEQAVRTGRLLRPLASTGLEAVDLVAAVAAPDAAPAPRAGRGRPVARAHAGRARGQGPAKRPAKAPPPERDARAERAAAKAVQDARAAFERAETALDERDSELAAARDAVAAARDRVAELDAALSEATQQQTDAERRRRDADQARRTAARARDAAQRALGAASRKSKT